MFKKISYVYSTYSLEKTLYSASRKLFLRYMIKPNIKYLGFDDRLLLLLGIPFLALIIPLIFFGLDIPSYLKIFHQQFPESIVYSTLYWLFNRYLIIALRKRFTEFADTLKRFAIQLAVIVVFFPIISFSTSWLLKIVFKLMGTSDLFQPTFFQGIGATYVLTFSITMLYDTIYFFHKYKEAILEKEKIHSAHIQGQLENLRNQINPHFLFNSLNTLMNLIPTDPNRAMNYLDKLSKFYRYAVSNQEQQLVPLKTELENVKLYADLLKERFHEGIEITIENKAVNGTQILPLCLQLLIENAVKHNIVSKKKPLHIEVKKEGNYILVKNNIQQRIHEVKSTGMGLKNIRERIAFFTNAPLLVKTDEKLFEVAVPLIMSY
ncbi:MAG: histidine kinase [Bacteroidota bacterium]